MEVTKGAAGKGARSNCGLGLPKGLARSPSKRLLAPKYVDRPMLGCRVTGERLPHPEYWPLNHLARRGDAGEWCEGVGVPYAAPKGSEGRLWGCLPQPNRSPGGVGPACKAAGQVGAPGPAWPSGCRRHTLCTAKAQLVVGTSMHGPPLLHLLLLLWKLLLMLLLQLLLLLFGPAGGGRGIQKKCTKRDGHQVERRA